MNTHPHHVVDGDARIWSLQNPVLSRWLREADSIALDPDGGNAFHSRWEIEVHGSTFKVDIARGSNQEQDATKRYNKRRVPQ